MIPILDVQSITKVFTSPSGDTVALAPTSLRVAEGEFISLVGPSGCGKSTLLFILAGLEEQTSGYAFAGGQEICGPGADRGMVFQNYTLYPWLTVRQNILFSTTLRAHKGAPPHKHHESRCDELLHRTGLTDFADALPRTLSGGMKQRVAIARALLPQPKIIFMDEPFGALDAITREEMQQLTLDLVQEEKMTVVMVTHDIDEALFLSTRALVMSRRPGRIIDDIDVPFGASRPLTLKLDPRFIALRRRVFDVLHDHAENSRHDLSPVAAGSTGASRNTSVAREERQQ